LQLESGEAIPDFRMTYIAHGTLNEQRDNAILSLHGLRGTRETQSVWAGPGRAFDTHTYFVIQPDTLGVASLDPDATPSPSRSGLKMRFPRFTIRDMVQAEHRFLTECLKITRLVAVFGTSMGGIESLQWAVTYRHFMDAVIAALPQARANKQSVYIWEAARRVIMLDPDWQHGEYEPDRRPLLGTAYGLNIQSAFGLSAPRFEEQYPTREAVVASYDAQAASATNTDARDWMYRTWAIDQHDISSGRPFSGDLAAAARSIRARTLLFPNCFDQLLPPRESGVYELGKFIPAAKVVNLNDREGHGAAVNQQALITREVRDLLGRIASGRPGIRGPRFPDSGDGGDFCSGGPPQPSR
jgi:homoserine O-acetyltransferase